MRECGGPNVILRSTHHQQCLTKRSTSLSQDLVWTQRDDVAQREDERMYIFHVEIISRHGIGDRVLGKDLRLFHGISDE